MGRGVGWREWRQGGGARGKRRSREEGRPKLRVARAGDRWQYSLFLPLCPAVSPTEPWILSPVAGKELDPHHQMQLRVQIWVGEVRDEGGGGSVQSKIRWMMSTSPSLLSQNIKISQVSASSSSSSGVSSNQSSNPKARCVGSAGSWLLRSWFQ